MRLLVIFPETTYKKKTFQIEYRISPHEELELEPVKTIE
jgi:hypothetical protein